MAPELSSLESKSELSYTTGGAVYSDHTCRNLHELQMATSQPLGLVLHYSFRTITSLGLAFYTSWNLSLVTLAGIPVFSVIISFLSTKMKPSIQAQQEELSIASKVVNSATFSIDTVKCLNGQAFELRGFTTKVEAAASQYLKHARLNSFQISIVRLMMFSMFVQGFWYGSDLATSGKLSSGEVLRTFWACLSAAQSIELVLPQVILLEKGKLAASSLSNVLNGQTHDGTAAEMKGEAYPRYCEGDIEVSDVSVEEHSPGRQPRTLANISDLVILRILISARQTTSQLCQSLLSCRRDHFCHW